MFSMSNLLTSLVGQQHFKSRLTLYKFLFHVKSQEGSPLLLNMYLLNYLLIKCKTFLKNSELRIRCKLLVLISVLMYAFMYLLILIV